MPGGDRDVYVRITPFDNDTGVSDTIVFRLDNNYPPVVKIDSEGDSLSYRYRYRFDSVWVDADVEYVGSVGDTV